MWHKFETVQGFILEGDIKEEEAGFDHAFGYENAEEYVVESFTIKQFIGGHLRDNTKSYFNGTTINKNYEILKEELIESYLQEEPWLKSY